MKEFYIGQPVYFCYGYGETHLKYKNYRYGEVYVGFITQKKYIDARNSYLYTVSTLACFDNKKVVNRLLGQHLIFSYDENGYAKCLEQCKAMCEEVEE